MKRLLRLLTLAGVCVVLGMTGAVQAVEINYNFDPSTVNELTTPYSWATVETFNNPTLAWSWTGINGQLGVGAVGGALVTGSVTSSHAAPHGKNDPDSSQYLATTGKPGTSGNVTANLGASYDYFGIWWGSLDDYNSISFFDGAALVKTITFADLWSKNPDGSWVTGPANFYVNFLGLPRFTSFTLTSTWVAFEVDNIAVGNVPVPEPSTLLLLGAGLLGVAGLNRRRRA